MDSLESAFESLVKKASDGTNSIRSHDASSNLLEATFESLPEGPQEEFVLQEQIRPYFGKQGINDTEIGTHPDFIHLEDHQGSTVKHHVCTLFVDIVGSTRLQLIYDLNDVFVFKNAVIQACIEAIRSLDGHVHRIMGDAVMGFFGGQGKAKEDAVADALNACAIIRYLLENVVTPWMEKQGWQSNHFGFRVGCDFGDDNDVLWGAFGYQSAGEVSAAGLPVDMASKLQGNANKNQIMLGEGLLDFIDWPESFSQIKEEQHAGETRQVHHVVPNITYEDGTSRNYKMRILDYKRYMGLCPLPPENRETIDNTNVVSSSDITFECYVEENDGQWEHYISSSRFLDKNKWLKFYVIVYTRGSLRFPINVKLTKVNRGNETPEDEKEEEQIVLNTTLRKGNPGALRSDYLQTEKDEATLYRSMHTMCCEVWDNTGTIVYRNWIGVMIK